MSIALLVIDTQKGFYAEGNNGKSMDLAVESINYVASMFRQAGYPVIFVQDEDAKELDIPNAFDVIDEIHVHGGDYMISKTFSNAFHNTELKTLLEDLEVSFVVISGFAAEHCVLFTLNGAFEQGFEASLLQGGIAGENQERVNDTYIIRPTISYQAIKYILDRLE